MAATAGLFAAQGFMALGAAQGVGGRHDLMVEAPVHDRLRPGVLAAVGQPRRLHAQFEGFLPVQGVPVSVRAEQVGYNQHLVLGIGHLFAPHELERIDFRSRVLKAADRFGEGW